MKYDFKERDYMWFGDHVMFTEIKYALCKVYLNGKLQKKRVDRKGHFYIGNLPLAHYVMIIVPPKIKYRPRCLK